MTVELELLRQGGGKGPVVVGRRGVFEKGRRLVWVRARGQGS